MGKDVDVGQVIPKNSISVPGYGCAEFCCIPRRVPSADGSHIVELKTVNSKLHFTHPLKLMVKQLSGRCVPQSECQWLYKLQSAGQLSGGGCISLNIGVAENCKVVLTTQQYPKILATDDCSMVKQGLTVHVADRAILAVLPDPTICYKNAKYQQEQVFNLTSGGNLILLDWLIAGRIALGEVWDMTSFVSENKVYIDRKLVYGDAISLQCDFVNAKENRICSVKESLGHTKVLGTCVLIGPRFKHLKWIIHDKVKRLSDDETSEGLTACASVLNQPLCDGVVIKLLAAQSTEEARSFFRRVIEDTTAWFEGDPLAK